MFLRTSVDESIGARRNTVTLSDYGWTSSHPARVAAAEGRFVYHGLPLPAEPIAGQRAVHAAYGVGVSGYALGTDVFMLDVLGLGNPLAAHLELHQRSLPGHEKPLPAPWIVATGTAPGTDLDEDDFPYPLMSTRLDDPDRAPFDTRVAVARLILECPRLKEFRASYTEPLTLGRFLENVVDAPSNTSLRIPAEPADAAAELC
jgi:arabinofuranosyltransferase